MLYKDRQDAGQQLAEKLKKYRYNNLIIIALPRGGVILGYEVAKAFKVPLDIVAPRKIGAPFHPEFGIGAIAPLGVKVLDTDTINQLRISDAEIEEIVELETNEMNRRTGLYRKDLPPLDLKDKTVIVVDDGIATGVSTKAAILSIKKMNPEKIILAVPVCPQDTQEKFKNFVDEFICLYAPFDFYAVGAFYDDFRQISDGEVIELLEKAKS